jgi:SAM-dependent methyltransferase
VVEERQLKFFTEKPESIPDLATHGDFPELTETYEFYTNKFPDEKLGVYSKFDWQRIRDAYLMVDGKSVLDVGVGNGAFLQVLHRSKRFDHICGIDVRRHSMLQLPEGVDFRIMSATNMRAFPNGSFDSVVCMEVLEHLEAKDFYPALDELRRVTKNSLIVTVPFNEPQPVWWHDRPGGHRQSFDRDMLEEIFENAIASKLERHGVPWLLIVEDPRFEFEGFRITEYRDMIGLL